MDHLDRCTRYVRFLPLCYHRSANDQVPCWQRCTPVYPTCTRGFLAIQLLIGAPDNEFTIMSTENQQAVRRVRFYAHDPARALLIGHDAIRAEKGYARRRVCDEQERNQDDL